MLGSSQARWLGWRESSTVEEEALPLGAVAALVRSSAARPLLTAALCVRTVSRTHSMVCLFAVWPEPASALARSSTLQLRLNLSE